MTVERLLAGESVVGQSERQLLDRFVSDRDEVAFEAIVARHGPMVLGVCRSILDHSTDVEDAFQATFLVLVRKAGSLRDRDQLSPWLHGVARRVALRARGVAARRRGREIGQPDFIANAPDRPGRSAEARELAALIHTELGRLSLAERSAILLCDLEGLSHQEAADQLGWPLGTVKTRITRGRERLRVRLSRRGVSLGAVGITSALAAESVAAAVVARTLLVVTTRSALAVVAGRSLAVGVVTSPVYFLTQGALRTMIFTKLKALAIGLAATSVALAVPGVVAYQAQQTDPGSRTRPETKATPPVESSRPEPVYTFKKDTGSSVQFLGVDPTPTDNLNLAILRKLEDPSPIGPIAQAQLKVGLHAITFKQLAKIIQDASVDPAVGLPEGIPVEFTFAGAKLAEVGMIEFADLNQENRATPLREVLTREAKAFRLSYRVSRGKLVFDFDTDPVRDIPGGVTMDRERTRTSDDKERNEAIQAKLDQVVPLKFPQGISLDDFVAAIKQATRSPEGMMIPIYLDPKSGKEPATDGDQGGASNNAFNKTASSIVIDLDNVPLRTSLRLALRQLNLDYDVAGGVLIIGNMFQVKGLSQLSAPLSIPTGMGGMGGGGMGGMGGGMGGGFR